MDAQDAHLQPGHADGEPLAAVLRPRGPVHLELIEEHRPNQTVIRARGELDLLTARRLAGCLDAVLRSDTGDVLVDLSETEFIDSSALQVLLSAQRRLTRDSRGFGVVCGEGPVRRVIELARLVETLNVTDPAAQPKLADPMPEHQPAA